MASLADKVALVTGASRGIGRAIALRLAAEGANVAVCARNLEAAKAVAGEIQATGVSSFAQATDVSVGAEVDALIKRTIDDLGSLDILVNNAGLTRDNLLMRMSEEDWDAVIDVNLKGAFNCCKAAVRPMLKARRGRIINVSSVVGIVGNPGQANYVASKAGLIGLTKTLARELAPEIKVVEELEAVLRDEQVRAVAIATPAETHRELAERCLQAGKDVFVEKPMARYC